MIPTARSGSFLQHPYSGSYQPTVASQCWFKWPGGVVSSGCCLACDEYRNISTLKIPNFARPISESLSNCHRTHWFFHPVHSLCVRTNEHRRNRRTGEGPFRRGRTRRRRSCHADSHSAEIQRRDE